LPWADPAWVRSQFIGRDSHVHTPFGQRRIVYADHVASGRALQWIEDFIAEHVLPLYANTHTEDSATGARMTALAHDAAATIKRCLGVRGHKLLFCGTGCTGAIKRLQEMLGLVVPEALRQQVIDTLGPAQRPIVFVGPYEHHSNEVSWRQTIAEVVALPLDREGALDLDALREALSHARATGRPLIGSFSAASNVTGAITDTRAAARLLHGHGALAFFDFAAAAAHGGIEMREGQPDAYDAVFIATHKLPGGPGTPGLLVFDPALYRLRAPCTAGGGTVAFVNEREHHFVADIEQREDAGTPGTVQRIRAALAFMVQASVGPPAIERLEGTMIRSAIARLRRHPRIELLGNLDAPRLPILSFLVRTAGGQHVHPRLVVRLLNDLFGIQSRGGCACAGPYAHRLLGIDTARSAALRDAVLAGFEVMKPGWTRLDFSYFIEPAEFEFLLDAIEFVGDHGERFISAYRCDWLTGAWHHPHDKGLPGLWILATRSAEPLERHASAPMGHRDCLLHAHAVLAAMGDLSPVTAPTACGLPQALPPALVSFAC
jgi:selenocysteine lyase/cysteine desulfurase